jgi:hypothetical protein
MEFGSLFVEGQREVGTPKHDRLCALVLEQAVAHGIGRVNVPNARKRRRPKNNSGDLQQNATKSRSKKPAKLLKGLVGTAGFEPTTSTV